MYRLTAQTIDLHILETTDAHISDYDYYNDSLLQAFGLVYCLFDRSIPINMKIYYFSTMEISTRPPMSDYIAKIEGQKVQLSLYSAVNVLQYDALARATMNLIISSFI